MRQQTGRHRSLNLLRGEVYAGVGSGEPPQFEHGLHPLLVVGVGGVLLPPQAAAEMERGTEIALLWQLNVIILRWGKIRSLIVGITMHLNLRIFSTLVLVNSLRLLPAMVRKKCRTMWMAYR